MTLHASRRFARPLLYAATAIGLGGGVIYYYYRPRNIPGQDRAAVPLRFAENGTIAPPTFPKVKSRAAQIEDLKRSGGIGSSRAPVSSWLGSPFGSAEAKGREATAPEEPYDLLVIGGGATGAGVALDAATRGLKVALVERDDFSAGTSSKSTKLVHGGVRYLEKAVWELDYNQ
jgi:glycerol-3-phosphate dehydrogenase